MEKISKGAVTVNYYLSDTHFYDKKCLGYDGRPFVSVESMNETIVKNWNRVVKPDDTVYLIGDFSYGRGGDVVSISQRLAGHKILIRGNHDSGTELDYAFEKIYDYLELPTENGIVILSHYPIASYKDMQKPGTVHLYGHVHNSYEAKLCNDVYSKLRALKGYPIEAYNVGVMQPYMAYTPRTIPELRTLTKQFPLDFSH